MMVLELKSKEFYYHIGVVYSVQEVVEADITKVDLFLESKPRDANVAYARCRFAVVCYMHSSYVIYVD